jgi:hypothetical protein
MVLKAQIGGYDIGRVFMDAESGINLIYARTLKAMFISLESLKAMWTQNMRPQVGFLGSTRQYV